MNLLANEIVVFEYFEMIYNKFRMRCSSVCITGMSLQNEYLFIKVHYCRKMNNRFVVDSAMHKIVLHMLGFALFCIRLD